MRKPWSRRQFLNTTVVSGALSALPSTGFAIGDEEDDEDWESLYWDNAEPLPDHAVRTKALRHWPRWSKQDPRPVATWAPGGAAVDTAHLQEPHANDAFRVDARVLKRALAVSHIDPSTLGKRVLVGVRACDLLNADRFDDTVAFRPALKLAEASPDHYHLGCVMAVWDREHDTFWASRASTVCNVAYLFAQAQAKHQDKLCNLLPTGVYRYRVGTHRNGAKSRQPGALRLDSPVAIVRNHDTEPLGFSSGDVWEFRGPDVGDNIHAAYIPAKGRPHFSSAGCQVIPGTVADKRTRPTGAWRAFRMAAGLAADPTILTPNPERPRYVETTEDGQERWYLLFSARELRQAAALKQRDVSALSKLRRGSTGESVRRLQDALSLDIDGQFGFQTQRALILRQQMELGYADGILTRAHAQALGFKSVFA